MTATKTRELRERVPVGILKELRATKKKYGELRKLSIKVGIKYANFHLIVTTGEATPQNIKKISKALNIAA